VLPKVSHVQGSQKAREILAKMEADGDTRGFVLALREVRECLESLGQMLARAEAHKAN
jgi:hypothetical protein